MHRKAEGGRTCRFVVRAALLLLTTTACAPQADSGGTSGPSTLEWTIGDIPFFSIGVDEGPLAFSGIRGGRFLGSGKFAVADAGSSTVFIFDEDGRVAGRMGGRGEGPSEFQGIASLHAWGLDSLSVYDAVQRRVTVLDPLSGSARVIPLSNLSGIPPYAVAPFRDGLVVITGTSIAPGSLQAGRQRVEGDLVLYAPPDWEPHTITTLPTQEIYVSEQGGFAFPALPSRTLLAVMDDAILVSRGESPEIEVIRMDGGGRTTWTFPALRLSLAQPVAGRVRDSLVATAPNRVRMERTLEIVPLPDSLGGIGELVVGSGSPEGPLLVTSMSVPGIPDRTWMAINPDGAVIGRFNAPRDLSVLDIRGDRLLVVRRSDLGVERLELLELERRE